MNLAGEGHVEKSEAPNSGHEGDRLRRFGRFSRALSPPVRELAGKNRMTNKV